MSLEVLFVALRHGKLINHKMKKVYSNIFLETPSKEIHRIKNLRLRFIIFFLKSLFYSIMVFFSNGLGIKFHFYIAINSFIAFFKKKINFNNLFFYTTNPLDSFRYFEFHYAFKFIRKIKVSSYLDISSPRFLPSYIIQKKKLNNACILNPDQNDIILTKEIYKWIGIQNRCNFYNDIIENCQFNLNSFDLISSISVLEHIPPDNVIHAIKKIKTLLKSDGYFLVSVPVAKIAFDEYINFNEYNLQELSSDGYYFGQRFHDTNLIKELFIDNFGLPVFSKIYGEKVNGFFNKNRFEKINYINYPCYKESYIFYKNYKKYSNIDELPGLGVAIYLFKNTSEN